MKRTVLNRQASTHKTTVFREDINVKKNLGPRIIELANEAIKRYFGRLQEDSPFEPGSRTRTLYDKIEALWNERYLS
jgi:hypothetical protein